MGNKLHDKLTRLKIILFLFLLGRTIHENAGRHRRPVEERTRAVLKSHLALDYDLYGWIKKRFYDQKKLMNFVGS